MAAPTQRFVIRFPNGREIISYDEETAQESATRAEENGETFECEVEDIKES